MELNTDSELIQKGGKGTIFREWEEFRGHIILLFVRTVCCSSGQTNQFIVLQPQPPPPSS